jgi:hypothetical protein
VHLQLLLQFAKAFRPLFYVIVSCWND